MADLLAINGDSANEPIFVEHRDNEKRASTGKVCKTDDGFVPFQVRLTGSDVFDVGDLFSSGDVAKTTFEMRVDDFAEP